MTFEALLSLLGEEVDDVDEEPYLETFHVFSIQTGSHALGMIDAHANTLDISVAGHDMVIHQSPGLLTSNRSEGTTGAVLWKITPLFAEWMATSNFLFQYGLLHERSSVLELGCGIAGLVGLVMAPKVGQFALTDQEYVVRLLKQNIQENTKSAGPQTTSKHKKAKITQKGPTGRKPEVLVLDWEQSSLKDANFRQVLGLSRHGGQHGECVGLDAVLACDCVFNEHLIDPFVRTCASLCQFPTGSVRVTPTLCVIGQQVRSADVFQQWLEAMTRRFRVWRVPEKHLTKELKETSGFIIHIAILR